jgi:hypothetical protein
MAFIQQDARLYSVGEVSRLKINTTLEVATKVVFIVLAILGISSLALALTT